MKHRLLLLVYFFFYSSFVLAQNIYCPGFPRWLKNDNYRTDQTSGIVYLENDYGKKEFLLIDDIGQMHRMFISNDTVLQFHPIVLSGEVKSYLRNFPKWDFEEITYDQYTQKIYISIEGNFPAVKKTVGIYEVKFRNNNIHSDTITDLVRLDIQPKNKFLEYVSNNIGYEGLAVDSNYLYLGLEGFQNDSDFADSTYIYIVRKKDLKIVARCSTKGIDIHTICGLHCYGSGKLLVIDRNLRKLHAIKLDPKNGITSNSSILLPAPIPGYPILSYTASLESVTMDPDGNIYLVDDPWKSRFMPEESVFNKLDEQTRKNFKDIIPVIYKLPKSTFLKEE